MAFFNDFMRRAQSFSPLSQAGSSMQPASIAAPDFAGGMGIPAMGGTGGPLDGRGKGPPIPVGKLPMKPRPTPVPKRPISPAGGTPMDGLPLPTIKPPFPELSGPF